MCECTIDQSHSVCLGDVDIVKLSLLTANSELCGGALWCALGKILSLHTREWAQAGIWGGGNSSARAGASNTDALLLLLLLTHCGRDVPWAKGAGSSLSGVMTGEWLHRAEKRETRPTLEREKVFHYLGVLQRKDRKDRFTSCFKKGVIYPDPKLVCREVGSYLYSKTSVLT